MRKLWATVLAFLAISAFEEEDGVKKLTAEQKQKLGETFGEAFATKFADDLKDKLEDLPQINRRPF